ncbi:MAG: hypothetical protein KAI06_11495 [Anaerolineales bacterium]|nr:hypothetical protein [Anaerolineales bacterium]
MSNKIVKTIVALLIPIGILAAIVYAVIAPAVDTVYEIIVEDASHVGEEFLRALKDSDYDRAFSLLHSELQQELGTKEEFERNFPLSHIDTWILYETGPGFTQSGEPAVVLEGVVSLMDVSVFDIQIFVQREGNEDRIAEYFFNPIS